MPRLTTFFAKPNERLHLYRPPLAVQFNPKAWAGAMLKDMTGPYAYALNLPQIGECKPGNLFTPPAIEPEPKTRPADLLYARRDSNNLWSYREITEEGGCRRPYLPRQHDFNGDPVRNILKADFGRYSRLLGFASIPYDGIFYYRRIVLPEHDARPFTRAVPAQVTLARHP